MNKEELVAEVKSYLASLESDDERKGFLIDLGVCLLCGSTWLPCYCAPIYDD